MLTIDTITNIEGFEKPWWFALLLLLPVFYLLVALSKQYLFERFLFPDIENLHTSEKAKHGIFNRHPRLADLISLRRSPRFWLFVGTHICFGLTYIFLILALAGPYGNGSFDSRNEGVDIMFVLDMSRSMKAYDYQLDELEARTKSGLPIHNRFETAASTIKDFVAQEAKQCTKAADHPRCDRIGLVIFGNNAYLDIPLTTNYNLFDTFLNRRYIDDIPATQTAIGDGIARAVASLRHAGKQDRVIILLTDGDKKGGQFSIAQSLQAANNHNIKVFPILIGNANETYVRVEHDDSYAYQKADYPVNFPLLKSIADQTGGFAYQSASDQQLLESFNTILSHLEKDLVEIDNPFDHLDYSRVFALLAFIFSLFGYFFRCTLTRIYP